MQNVFVFCSTLLKCEFFGITEAHSGSGMADCPFWQGHGCLEMNMTRNECWSTVGPWCKTVSELNIYQVLSVYIILYYVILCIMGPMVAISMINMCVFLLEFLHINQHACMEPRPRSALQRPGPGRPWPFCCRPSYISTHSGSECGMVPWEAISELPGCGKWLQKSWDIHV